MGLIRLVTSLIKKLIKLGLVLVVLGTILILIPNLPPYTQFSVIKVDPELPRIGPLSANTDLNDLVKTYENKLLGPEALQIYNGELYTGLATGEIVKLSQGGHVTFVTKIGKPCSGVIEARKCGRPLGFVIEEKSKHLYVADAYYGIWKVDLKTDKKTLLVSPRVAIDGRQPKIINSLALASNGDIYWTDSSSDFELLDGAYTAFADPSGRLFHYNAAKNQSRVLVDNIWFPNGVLISPDNQFVLYAETYHCRIMKYYINGPKKGKVETFITGLPGTPDNLRALPGDSGVLAALYTATDADNPLIAKRLAETPAVRKLLARLLRLIEIPFEFLNAQFPNPIFENIVFHIGHFSSASVMLPDLAGLVHLDWNGNVVASHYHTLGKLEGISDAIVFNDRLYTGSPNMQNFLASFPVPPYLKKAYATTKTTPPKQAEPVKTKPVEKKTEEKVVKPVVKEAPKPAVKEAPKPVVKEAPKPVEKKPAEPKTPPPPKPTPAPKAAEPKPTTPPPSVPKTSPPKKEQPKVATPQKPTTIPMNNEKETKTTTPKPETKTTTEKPATKPKQPEVKKPADTKPQKQASAKPLPEQIPIKEEIPSDTIKPVQENLKVIKKGGPTEIPNHNV